MTTAVLVIGIGNALRRDDGAGIAVARALREAGAPARVKEATGEGGALLSLMESEPVVILVDAASSGGVPGTVTCMAAHEETIPSNYFNYSTHNFGVAEAIELARALGQLPDEVWIYAIEGADFGAGGGLSPAVEDAVRRVADQILDELENLSPYLTRVERAANSTNLSRVSEGSHEFD